MAAKTASSERWTYREEIPIEQCTAIRASVLHLTSGQDGATQVALLAMKTRKYCTGRGRVLVFAERDMAETAYLAGAAILEESGRDSARFSLLVRITHWLNTISFIALVVSGIGILLAHPRFYWGETGGLGTP